MTNLVLSMVLFDRIMGSFQVGNSCLSFFISVKKVTRLIKKLLSLQVKDIHMEACKEEHLKK